MGNAILLLLTTGYALATIVLIYNIRKQCIIKREYNMTRKDYVKIADILANQNATKSMIEEFMSMLKCDNYRFDKDRFQDYIAKKQNIQRGKIYGNVNLYS